ncbi:hypothetical protein EME01_52980 [Sinorhizobium meliloti]|nr:hypothetical protein EME01_52980 [Sinorhizobium meliloti]
MRSIADLRKRSGEIRTLVVIAPPVDGDPTGRQVHACKLDAWDFPESAFDGSNAGGAMRVGQRQCDLAKAVAKVSAREPDLLGGDARP